MRVRRLFACAVAAWILAAAPAWAAELIGQVTFNGQPVPGATVTATKPSGGQDGTEIKKVTASDPQGVYRFPDLAEGIWTVTCRCSASRRCRARSRFRPTRRRRPSNSRCCRSTEITRGLPKQAAEPPLAAAVARRRATPAARNSRRRRTAAVTHRRRRRGRGAGPGPPAASSAPPPIPTRRRRRRPPRAIRFRDDGDDAGGGNANAAADGLLINGSVNNGAASPFAQARAFGNNRPGGRGLYNGGVGLLTSNSAFDSRPFSFNGAAGAQAAVQRRALHRQLRRSAPHPELMRRGPNFFGNYQRVQDHNATTQSALMPTALERGGDFSQSAQRVRPAGAASSIRPPASRSPATSSRPIASARRRRRCSATTRSRTPTAAASTTRRRSR